MPRNGSYSTRLQLSLPRGCKRMPARCCSTERACRGAYQLTEDSIARMPRWQRWALYAFAALTLTGILPYGRCRPSGLVVRSRGLVASHPALHRGWSRLVARDLVMKAEVYRDNAGFWMARIEGRRARRKTGASAGSTAARCYPSHHRRQGGSRSGLAPRHEP